jgi:hypothetical protein
MRRLAIFGCLTAALLAACGGANTITSGSSSSGSSSGTSSGTGTTIVSLGSDDTAGSFQVGVIGIQSTSLAAGGSTSLEVVLVDQTGAAYTGSSTVTFSSKCTAEGLATITTTGSASGTATITTTTGSAGATYVATGCSIADPITATASANSQTLTANGTITVQAATIGSIEFVSATPSNITLKGTGATIGGTSSATSTVIFKVLDSSGGPSPNAPVKFSANTTVGGITITPTSGETDATGQIQTVVTGGTVATTVRITATTTTSAGVSISTQSSALTISTGIPTSANISLAVACWNVEAFNEDGVNVTATVRMSDRFSNPVPDGTTANFQTTLGGIVGTCQTGPTGSSPTNTPGECAVTWTSKEPYSVAGNPQTTAGSKYLPAGNCVGPSNSASQKYCNTTTNGRSPIYATAVGEESFVDANGNGIFDAGDTVAFDAVDKDNDFTNGSPKPWFDTSEPFLNEWELYDAYSTPIYIAGEPFIDFNVNGMRDGPDGLFNGTLCEGSLCAPSGKQSAAIYSSNIIIASTPQANYWITSVSPTQPITQPTSGTPSFSLQGGNAFAISMWIFDLHYQQMAATTTVTTTTVPSGETVTIEPSGGWPCSNAPPTFDATTGDVLSAGQLYSFTLTGAVPGSLYISVKSPGGLITTFPITITM